MNQPIRLAALAALGKLALGEGAKGAEVGKLFLGRRSKELKWANCFWGEGARSRPEAFLVSIIYLTTCFDV